MQKAKKLEYISQMIESFLVHESNFNVLLRKCLRCGGVIDDINEMKGDGTQARFKLSCAAGCVTSWSVQPQIRKLQTGFL